ncbi:hypothetical protein FF011L_44720 [Roseimaritima multifibrata]|uniref:Uncharacterized protein n=1 Tax=Roseimaritima multifibrata TaxID=1930274 RepID=A0A517MLB5_9BACT|nr:hypothetical protein FF011L_44720 [Roseimaritima multifibrata]
MPSHRKRVSWRRFSIQSALIAVACTSVIFATYRLGLKHGRSLGPIVPTNVSVNHIYSRDYDISDLAKSDEETELIISTIRKSVDTVNWDVAGGYAELRHDPGSQTIAVSHVWPGHVELVRFLETAREYAAFGRGLEVTLEDASTNF